jgi:hypothetical protein
MRKQLCLSSPTFPSALLILVLVSEMSSLDFLPESIKEELLSAGGWK